MSIREANLISINSTDLTASDHVRVLDNNSSRKITLQEFTESIDPLLVAEGFIKSTPDTSLTLRTVTANTTLLSTDNIVNADSTSGNVTVTLMAASDVSDGATTQFFTVKSKANSGNKVTLSPTGGATIDGQTSIDLFGFNSVTIYSDSFNWFIAG